MRRLSFSRSGRFAVAGFALAASLCPLVAPGGNVFAAHAETFDARWSALGLPAKQDRLAPPRPSARVQVVSINDPASRTTTLNKIETRATRNSPVRELPSGGAEKDKLPDGCEPSFSPVAAPSMANISGRCIAAAPSEHRLAKLSH